MKLKRNSLMAILTLSLIGLGGITQAFARELPRPMATDSRIKVVAFQPNNIVPVHASNLINTQVIFGDNEHIVNIQSGDSSAWNFNVNQYLSNVLNLKPIILGSHTDLDVVTIDTSGKRRYYRFDLMSPNNPQARGRATYAIRFVYPEEERQKTLAALNVQRLEHHAIVNASQNPKAYNWNYSFHGSRTVMPLHVFDDGTFTYMQLRSHQPVPAVFAVNNTKGQEAIVNVRRVGNYLVVQSIAPQFTLRDGRFQVASVFNNQLIQKLQG